VHNYEALRNDEADTPGASAAPGLDVFYRRVKGEGLKNMCRLLAFFVEQKRGVPRLHGNMLPGNSFPQICVVSVDMIVENDRIAQEYLCAMTQSNQTMY
jgi:hypothetical protein